MRRIAVVAALLALAGAAFVSAGAGGGDGDQTYRLVFDNAFGVVTGADFKVGGVAVGEIADLDVTRTDSRALITVSVHDRGFGALKRDARCSIQPQSLIGEYFVDCRQGRAGADLPAGGTIPVGQTESPIPADLVANVMRRPYRERFSIILGQLGAGLAARGEDLDQTIRRALPALSETNRVLTILARNRRTLREVTRDSATVMRVLGRRRKDVGRFVVSAKDTAVAAAARRAELRETFRRFPGFLDQLEPTMEDLGTASSRLAPTFADLRVAAPSLTGLLRTLSPFSRTLEPALESLGAAGVSGRRAARDAAPLVGALGEVGKDAPELARNAALVLGDLDDRSRAVEPDPDSPGGKGYTGLEALLQYVFDQSQALNIFDQRGYILKINALVNECAEFTDAQEAKADPERYARCKQGLGPNQPGVTTPDTTAPGARTATAARRTPRDRREDRRAAGPSDRPERHRDEPAPSQPATPGLPDLLDRLPDLGPAEPSSSTANLLDFLLGP